MVNVGIGLRFSLTFSLSRKKEDKNDRSTGNIYLNFLSLRTGTGLFVAGRFDARRLITHKYGNQFECFWYQIKEQTLGN
jgi:hypothetical protein